MNLIPSTLPSDQVDFAQLFPSTALPGGNPAPAAGSGAPALGFEQVIAALQPAAPVASQPANLLVASPLTGDAQPSSVAVAEQLAGDGVIVAPLAEEPAGETETLATPAPTLGGKRGAAKADRTRTASDYGIRTEEDARVETRKNVEVPLCPIFDPMAAGIPVAQTPVNLEFGESVEATSDEDANGTMTFDDRSAADEGDEALAFSDSTPSLGEAVQPSQLQATRFEAAAFASKPGDVAYAATDASRASGSFTPKAQGAKQPLASEEPMLTNETGRGVTIPEADSRLLADSLHAVIRRASDVAMPRPAADASPSASYAAAEGSNAWQNIPTAKISAPVAQGAADRSADATSAVPLTTPGEGRSEIAMPATAELPMAVDGKIGQTLPLSDVGPAKPLVAREMTAAGVRPETQEENFAGVANAAETRVREPKSRASKTSLVTENKNVAKQAESVGTDVANASASMSLRTATPTLPHPVPEYTAAAASDGVTATEAAAQQTVAFAELSPEAVSEAHRAVEVVLRAVDQVAGREQNSVKLDFAIGDTELSVRVELRADEVSTTFTTDSSELRTALAHEWQSLSAATAERPVRLAQPVFTGSDSPSDSYLNQHSGGQSQRDGARSEQAAQHGWERRFHGGSGSRSSEQVSVVSPLTAFAPAGTALRLNLFA